MKPVNMAKRKLFATRSAIMLLTDSAKEEALIAKAIATTLTKCECKAPTNLQVFSNKINSTITLTAPLGVNSGNYAKYLEKLTNTLNETIGTELAHYLPFCRAPTDVDILVHGVNLLTIATTMKTSVTRSGKHLKCQTKSMSPAQST